MAPPPLYPEFDSRRQQPRDYERHDGNRGYDRRRPKKKEGWLGEIFDF